MNSNSTTNIGICLYLRRRPHNEVTCFVFCEMYAYDSLYLLGDFEKKIVICNSLESTY